MAITHDGISAPLPLDPVRVIIGLVLLSGAGALGAAVNWVAGGGLGLVALLFLLNLLGGRRIRVLEGKLLVEDEPLIMALLIGPRRNRIAWSEVNSVAIDGRKLVLVTTGKPFVTAQGATVDDLNALKARVDTAIAKSKRAAAP